MASIDYIVKAEPGFKFAWVWPKAYVPFHSPRESQPGSKTCTKQAEWSPPRQALRESLVIWATTVVPFPYRTTKQNHSHKTRGFPQAWRRLSPGPSQLSYSFISRYRAQRNHCSYKEPAIVRRFQRMSLAGFQGTSREGLAFQLRSLCLLSQTLPGYWQPQSYPWSLNQAAS